jgi:hypothetical protein
LVEDLASAAGAFEEKIKTAMSDSTRIRVEPPKKENLPQWIVDFFFFAFPLSPNRPIRYLFTVGLVSFFLCGAAGLRGTFPGYLRPPSLLSFFWTTQHEYHNTQHPWEAIRPGI